MRFSVKDVEQINFGQNAKKKTHFSSSYSFIALFPEKQDFFEENP